jgi:hypothetical protein
MLSALLLYGVRTFLPQNKSGINKPFFLWTAKIGIFFVLISGGFWMIKFLSDCVFEIPFYIYKKAFVGNDNDLIY